MSRWWVGALATVTGVAGFSWAVHYWNDGYRQVATDARIEGVQWPWRRA